MKFIQEILQAFLEYFSLKEWVEINLQLHCQNDDFIHDLTTNKR